MVQIGPCQAESSLLTPPHQTSGDADSWQDLFSRVAAGVY